MPDLEKTCHENYEYVLGFLTRLTGDPALAEELTQETFYQAAKRWKDYRVTCKPGTWLCGIAKNLYFSWRRKPKTVPLPEDEADPTDLTDMVIDKEQRMYIHKAMHELPEPYREVLTLRTLGELSYEEIGGLFARNAGWARVTAYRAKQMLLLAVKGERTNAL
ncbi:MAG: sigma-70 family RNA polymerase sigma factor [Clostridia bacterium]|nr:sigma-70 family RNA polymerase sigma factor [Clostridia bacterium]